MKHRPSENDSIVNLHFNLLVIVVSVHHEVWVDRYRSKFVCREDEKYVGGCLFEHFVQPNVLEWHRCLQQVNYDAREVDVAHNHYVELTKQSKFLQICCGLAIGGRSLLQVMNGPNHGE